MARFPLGDRSKRRVCAAERAQGTTLDVERERVVGVEIVDQIVLGETFLEAAGLIQDEGERLVKGRSIGVEFHRAAGLGGSLVEASQRGEVKAVPLVRGRVIRVQLDGAAQMAVARLPVPLRVAGEAERGVGLR